MESEIPFYDPLEEMKAELDEINRKMKAASYEEFKQECKTTIETHISTFINMNCGRFDDITYRHYAMDRLLNRVYFYADRNHFNHQTLNKRAGRTHFTTKDLMNDVANTIFVLMENNHALSNMLEIGLKKSIDHFTVKIKAEDGKSLRNIIISLTARLENLISKYRQYHKNDILKRHVKENQERAAYLDKLAAEGRAGRL